MAAMMTIRSVWPQNPKRRDRNELKAILMNIPSDGVLHVVLCDSTGSAKSLQRGIPWGNQSLHPLYPPAKERKW